MTKRSGLPGAGKKPLSGLESEVMDAVWRVGPAAVEAVHQVVEKKRDIKESTTRTVLRRLEEKGYVSHSEDGRAYVYRAVEAPRSFAAMAVRQIIDRFCKGSMAELVSGMVEAKVLSDGELSRLEEMVREAKAGREPGRETKAGGR